MARQRTLPQSIVANDAGPQGELNECRYQSHGVILPGTNKDARLMTDRMNTPMRKTADEHYAELEREIDAAPATPARKPVKDRPIPANVKPILDSVSKGIAEAIHEATKATQNAEILAKLDEVAEGQKELSACLYHLIDIMRAPKRLVKDRQGKVIGSETVMPARAGEHKDAAE